MYFSGRTSRWWVLIGTWAQKRPSQTAEAGIIWPNDWNAPDLELTGIALGSLQNAAAPALPLQNRNGRLLCTAGT